MSRPPLRRGSSKTALLLVVAALVAVAIGVFLLLDPTGTRGTDQGSRGASPAGAPPAASVDAPGSGRAGAQAPVVATAETDGSAAREVALDASLLADTEIVRGRLVVATAGAPPRDAIVAVRTGDDAIDYAALWRALGGEEEVRSLKLTGEMELRVRELGGWRPTYTARAAADGSFQVRVPRKAIRFSFEVTGEGAALAHPEWHLLSSPAVAAGLVLLLEEATIVEGRLTDETGRPIGGGFLRADPGTAWTPGRPHFTRRSETTADTAGRFRFPSIPSLQVEVGAVAEGFAPATAHALASRAGTTVELVLRLPREIPLEAEVVDASGRGVPDVVVRLARTPFPPSGLGYGIARSDARGRLRWAGLLAGKHAVRIAVDGAVPRETPPPIELPLSAGTPTPRWTLVPGHALAGRVVDAEDRPVEGALVRVAPWSEDETAERRGGRTGPHRETRTSADGAFRVTGLVEGPHRVHASLEERSSVEKAPVAPDGEDITLVMPEPTGITGVVLDDADGAPIESFVTTALSRTRQLASGGWVPPDLERPHRSADGAFDRLGLEPDTYELRVAADGYAEARQTGVVVRAGEIARAETTRLVRGAILRGKMIDRASGEPIGGALVEALRPDDGWGIRFAEERDSTLSRADGTYELRGLAAGRMEVLASHRSRREARSKPLEPKAGATVDVPPLALPSGGALEGVARAADGAPFAGGWVVDATPEAADGDWAAAQRRAIQGKAEVREGAVARVSFDPPPTGGCTVRGRVTRGGVAMRDMSVSLLLIDAQDTGGNARRDLQSSLDESGEYVIEHVPPGKALLHGYSWIAAPGGSATQFQAEITIPDQPELRLDVELPEGGRIHGRVTRRSNGEGVPGVSVQARRTSAIEPGSVTSGSGQGSTSASGDYELTGLATGEYVLTVDPQWSPFGEASDSKLAATDSGPVAVVDAASTRRDFALDEGGVLVVEVLDADGRPVSETYAMVQSLAEGRRSVTRHARTDGSGIARVAGVPEGPCFARANVGEGPFAYSDTLRATPGSETRVTIRVPPAVRLRIVARAPDGSVVALASVHVEDDARRYLASRSSSGGTAAGEDPLVVPPGPARLTVTAARYTASRTEITVGTAADQAVEVQLVPTKK